MTLLVLHKSGGRWRKDLVSRHNSAVKYQHALMTEKKKVSLPEYEMFLLILLLS